MYLQSARALLDFLREIAVEKVSEMLPGIDELPKTRKLTNELRFLLDVKDYEMSTLRDLVTVESFKTMMEREGHLMRELDFFYVEDV